MPNETVRERIKARLSNSLRVEWTMTNDPKDNDARIEKRLNGNVDAILSIFREIVQDVNGCDNACSVILSRLGE